jgi:hypothetical protein
MSTPVVTEIITRREPVAHDPFVDDLRVTRSTDAPRAPARRRRAASLAGPRR